MEKEFIIDESEVLLPSNREIIPPASEVWSLIQHANSERKNLKEVLEKEISQKDNDLEEFMVEVTCKFFELKQCVNELKSKVTGTDLSRDFKGLEILTKDFESFLKQKQLIVEDPTGKIVDSDLLEKIEIQSNVEEMGVEADRVKKTWIPLIYRNGVLIKPGIVDVAIPPKKKEV